MTKSKKIAMILSIIAGTFIVMIEAVGENHEHRTAEITVTVQQEEEIS